MFNYKTNVLRILLVIIHIFVFISTVSGSYGLVTGSIGIPLALLDGSIFKSFLIPGIILGLIVGGVNLVAFILLARRHFLGEELSAIAGLDLVIWIFVEMYIIKASHWLYALYFGLGILIIILSFIMVRVRKLF